MHISQLHSIARPKRTSCPAHFFAKFLLALSCYLQVFLRAVSSPLSACPMPPKAAIDQETAITRCVADIVAELISCKRKGGPMPAVDGLKSRMARKHGVNGVPKLSDIVAAVPDVDRKALLP